MTSGQLMTSVLLFNCAER